LGSQLGRWLAVALAVVTLGWAGPSVAADDRMAGVADLIRNHLVEQGGALLFTRAGVSLHDPLAVEQFYRQRGFVPAWSEELHPSSNADVLVAAVRAAEGEGLAPDHYHLAAVTDLLAIARRAPHPETAPPAALLADLDLLLTDAFLLLGCHYSSGCVNPITVASEWYARRRPVDIGGILEEALREQRVDEALQRLLPLSPAYQRLRAALERYRTFAAGDRWASVPDGPLLRRPMVDPSVALLRARLAATGDLPAEARQGEPFDSTVRGAVRRFQARHGLAVDGVVGPATRRALNVPATARLRQIEINLERLRWSPDKTAGRVILINIADFRLEVIEHGQPVMAMRVVAGKPYWHTPVFTAQMTYLVLNPSWNVPPEITTSEVLPGVGRDPGYLARLGLNVLSGWGRSLRVVDPGSVDWRAVNTATSPYRFQQPPGPTNPLGRIKFMLPNPFHVYLHDSPARELFAQPVRAFSHGCIRVEEPLDLALYALRGSRSWTHEALLAAIATGGEQTICLREPLDVTFLYLTAWADEEGRLQFREDVYDRDAFLARALHEATPIRP
jgi:murein L,D-transpeptidase YcbB/YkuD